MTNANITNRADEILKHMRLDLSLLSDPYHNWRLGKNVFSLGCTERHRITLYYQQVRAFNLVYALEKKGLLEKHTKICILGAGPAGVAAASSAALLGAEVLLLEKEHEILGVLGTGPQQNKRRLFHPTLDKWPALDWLNDKKDLPLYDWEQTENETSPQDLRCRFLNELRSILNCSRTKLRVFTGFQGQPEWKDGQWHAELDQCTESHSPLKAKWAAVATFDAEILILAFGFGTDKKREYRGSFGYFEDDAVVWDGIDKLGLPRKLFEDRSQDTLACLDAISANPDSAQNTGSICCNLGNQTVTSPPQIIVSGSGDGALIETINAVFHSSITPCGLERFEPLNCLFPKLVKLFKAEDYIPNWNDLQLKLQELESLIDGPNFTTEEMLARYKQLEDCAQHKETLRKVDEQLSSTFGVRRKVYLCHKDHHYMGVGNFAFLRFLVWRFVSMGLILPRRIEMTPEIYNAWLDKKGEQCSCDLEFSSSGLQWKFPGIHFIIPRHGPSWPFSKQSNNYPHLEDSAKALQELNKLDRTREPIWDAKFTERLKADCEAIQNP